MDLYEDKDTTTMYESNVLLSIHVFLKHTQ